MTFALDQNLCAGNESVRIIANPEEACEYLSNVMQCQSRLHEASRHGVDRMLTLTYAVIIVALVTHNVKLLVITCSTRLGVTSNGPNVGTLMI